MANTPAAGVVDSNFNAGGITPDGIYFVRNGQTIFYPYDALGGDGASNSIWRPTVSPEGEISWQRSMEATAPDPQNIKGPPGTDGAPGPAGSNGKTWKPAVSETGELSWSEDESGTPPAPVNIKGDPGTDAELPAGTMGDLLHHNGTDWVAEDPGTALAPNQRVGDLLVATASGGVEWMPEENAIPGIYADVAPLMAAAGVGTVLRKDTTNSYKWSEFPEGYLSVYQVTGSNMTPDSTGYAERYFPVQTFETGENVVIIRLHEGTDELNAINIPLFWPASLTAPYGNTALWIVGDHAYKVTVYISTARRITVTTSKAFDMPVGNKVITVQLYKGAVLHA